MSAIESVVKEADYVKEPRPLPWLKALDGLMATKKSYLPMTELTSIAIANGVEKDVISIFFYFLNELGLVLWLDEEGLRDVVILDIINFFVEPATLIICNHISETSDSSIHHRNIQVVCKKELMGSMKMLYLSSYISSMRWVWCYGWMRKGYEMW